MNRRDFLKLPAAASAVALWGDIPKANFPTSPRERLAVSTYPFRNVIGKITLEEFAQTIPSKFGVNGIEPWSPHIKSLDSSYIAQLKKSFDLASIHVVNLAVDTEGGVDEKKKWVDAAVVLGSPSIRVHLAKSNHASDTLRLLAQYGASKNIVITLENDDPKTEQPERIIDVIQAVSSPYLRSLPDFCNSMLIHDDQAYNNGALAKLFPLAYNISHAKDMESDEGKVYRVDLPHILQIAQHAGYRGYFSMECEAPGDPYEGTKKLLDACLANLT